MTKPSSAAVLQALISETIREILWFPLWWYTKGLKLTLKKLANAVKNSVKLFGLDIWVKNLFVPMYGETSITGRIISFMVRLFMIVIRGLAVGLWAAGAILLALAYIAVPPALILNILYHLGGMLF
ncbi:MAG: hypothetical protein P8J32_01680 [bacterium]|jgi:hypothetical protein|nr:hypothetical protein [bacterium]